MQKKLGLFCSVFLTACVFHHTSVPIQPLDKMHSFPQFNRVEIHGPFHVRLQTGYRSATVSVKNNGRPQIKVAVSHKTLFVRCMAECQQGQTFLNIKTRHLQSFVYDGQGEIIGRDINAPVLNMTLKNPGVTTIGGHLGLQNLYVSKGGHVTLTGVHSNHLNLIIKDHSKVQMSGQLRLSHLNLEDGSWISLYWLKADQLKVRAHGQSVIKMGGKARLIDVELWDKAQFRGRYLQTTETYVKTHQHAVAEIATVRHQHTVAADASDIYFYRIPDSKADFMTEDGSVLDMRLFDPALRYDPYNSFNLK